MCMFSNVLEYFRILLTVFEYSWMFYRKFQNILELCKMCNYRMLYIHLERSWIIKNILKCWMFMTVFEYSIECSRKLQNVLELCKMILNATECSRSSRKFSNYLDYSGRLVRYVLKCFRTFSNVLDWFRVF